MVLVQGFFGRKKVDEGMRGGRGGGRHLVPKLVIFLFLVWYEKVFWRARGGGGGGGSTLWSTLHFQPRKCFWCCQPMHGAHRIAPCTCMIDNMSPRKVHGVPLWTVHIGQISPHPSPLHVEGKKPIPAQVKNTDLNFAHRFFNSCST